MQLWGLTDPGNLREQNQDSYAMVSFSRDRSLMIVCDGMGGAKSGNVASSLAVDVFTDEVRRCQRPGMTPERGAEVLRGALELANKAVFEQAQVSDDFTGMGTTLVAALIIRDTAVIINVGDSRAYLFTAEGVQLLTTDHSIVEFMVQRGELTQEQAKMALEKRNYKSRRNRAFGRGRYLSAEAASRRLSAALLRRSVECDGRSGDAV